MIPKPLGSKPSRISHNYMYMHILDSVHEGPSWKTYSMEKQRRTNAQNYTCPVYPVKSPSSSGAKWLRVRETPVLCFKARRNIESCCIHLRLSRILPNSYLWLGQHGIDLGPLESLAYSIHHVYEWQNVCNSLNMQGLAHRKCSM